MRERTKIARKKETANEVPPIVQDVLSSSGQSLDISTREFMEPRFGHDFSQVRVHTDERAVESAQQVNALAYTVGQDVVFGEGQYEPETGEGKRLLAHELTHVVQQSRGGHQTPPPISTHPLEQVAQQAAFTVASGGTAHVEGASAPGIARQPRSINESLDPTSMSDADLAREIALIHQWLTENPASSAEQNQLMSALSTMETEVAQRNGRQNQASTDQGQQPDSASAGIHPVLAAGMLSLVSPLSPTTPPPGAIPEGAFNNWPRIPGEAPFQAPELAPELAPEVLAPEVLAPEALEVGAGVEVLEVGAGAEVLAVGAGVGAAETVTFLGLSLTPVGWVILAVGVGIVAGFAIYEGVNYLLKEDGTPARPLTPEENIQAKTNEGKGPADFPGQGGQSPAVDPITGEKLYTPANQNQAPGIDPTTGEKLYTPANQNDESMEAAGKRRGSKDTDDHDDNYREIQKRRDLQREQDQAYKRAQQVDPNDWDLLDNEYVTFYRTGTYTKAYRSFDEAKEEFLRNDPDAVVGNVTQGVDNSFLRPGNHTGMVSGKDGLYLGTIFEGTVRDIVTGEEVPIYTISYK